MSFGQTFRTAREAKGLTPAQVAAQTRILVQIITDMENEDFHRIPAPIYGRGFVRLYAECVDLDPAPLIHEFMEIFEGRRPPASAARPIPIEPQNEEPVSVPKPISMPEPMSTPTFEPPPAPEATPIPATPYAPPMPNVESPEAIPPFATQAAAAQPISQSAPEPMARPLPEHLWDPEPPQPQPAPQPEVRPQPSIVKGLDLFEQATAPQPPPVRPAAPTALPPQIDASSPFLSGASYEDGPSTTQRLRDGFMDISSSIIHRVHQIPRSAWRISLLVTASLLVLALIVFGCIKLYQATSHLPKTPCAERAKPTQIAKPAAFPTPPAPAATRTTKPAVPHETQKQKTPGKLRATGQKVPPLYMD